MRRGRRLLSTSLDLPFFSSFEVRSRDSVLPVLLSLTLLSPFHQRTTLITLSLLWNHGSHFEKHHAAFDEGRGLGGDDAYVDQDSEKGTEERSSTEKLVPAAESA
ncbi:hypothetical protein MSAN_01229400 [Mycena sanguinolenta]|uniref:Uncharacterized protein n=1 Tax=Mycena sanguinolenta TaxID=230812 RepID=A0A8H6YHP5_9AGAR|nr:hypothetical protein MSAN_01229400 [Mycena sanguinolenta]